MKSPSSYGLWGISLCSEWEKFTAKMLYRVCHGNTYNLTLEEAKLLSNQTIQSQDHLSLFQLSSALFIWVQRNFWPSTLLLDNFHRPAVFVKRTNPKVYKFLRNKYRKSLKNITLSWLTLYNYFYWETRLLSQSKAILSQSLTPKSTCAQCTHIAFLSSAELHRYLFRSLARSKVIYPKYLL